jgi:alpha-L-arabinofuranosidase
VKFVYLSALVAGWFVTAQACAATTVELTIEASRPGPVISRHLYGQVVGTGPYAYGGAWVGLGSAIPNTQGWRKDVVAALRDLRVPVLSWPGGCAADRYNWRDGIGPRSARPVKVLPQTSGAVDDNAIGTHEFFGLVELIGADAKLNGNVGTGSARESAEWLEYAVTDGRSTLARLRARNGHAKPFKVAYFGIGNAPWSCGGSMTPRYYADLYNQHAVFIKGKSATPPKLIASGSGVDWTDELSTRKRIRDYRDGISAHHGSDSGDPGADGEGAWITTLKGAWSMDGFIADQLARLDQNDPSRKLTLTIGEWRTRYNAGQGAGSSRQASPNTLRDALAAALQFHIFHAHAERVSMATFAAPPEAQQEMILAAGKQLVLTPTYHVFKMHQPFQDAVSLPVRLDNNPRYAWGQAGIPSISASAARGQDGLLYLSLVNAHPKDAVVLSIGMAGAVAGEGRGRLLTADTMDAHNSAAQPTAVAPAEIRVRAENGKLALALPAKSFAVLRIAETQPASSPAVPHRGATAGL